jgi:hypothetical protein
MSSFVEQLPALVGVAFGGGLSYLFANLSERGRHRRAKLTRWDDRRMLAYADYASALKTEVRLCLNTASALNLLPRRVSVELATARRLLAEAADNRAAIFDRVLLLAC